MSSTHRDEPLSLRPLLILCGLGVGLRVVLLFLTGELELQSDEANYAYSSLALNHFGVYFDHHRYLWPPGYTWFLSVCFERFGFAGLMVAKWVQVVASASVGLTTMLLTYRLFGTRAARLAGVFWVLYLPLAAFTHLLWNETLFLALFLPALYQLLVVYQRRAAFKADGRLIVAGVCLGATLYLKESPQYLILALAMLAIPFAGGLVEGVRRASLLLLVVGVVVLPWGLRNLEVYGRPVLGASLGENAFNGINESYRNFDLIPLEVARDERDLTDLKKLYRPTFVKIERGKGWNRVEPQDSVINTVDRSREGTGRGLAYARENPTWFLLSRVKKVADFVTPFSFFTRHLALGHYDGTLLGSSAGRKLTSLWALACPVAVLLLGAAGFFLSLRDRAGFWLLATVFGYFLATTQLVAMSRFRLPLVPLLIALSAGYLTRGEVRKGRLPVVLTVGSWLALCFLWWVNFPESWAIFREMLWVREA